MDDITVRRATAGDYDALCGLFEEIDAFHREAVPRVYRKGDGPARTREYIEGLLADPAVAIFVADVGGHLAGLVHAMVRDSAPVPIFVPRRYGIVDTLAVAQAYRRGGIARALMAAAEEWARAEGAQDMELGVWEFNAGAQAFYRQLGYETATRRMHRSLRAANPENT